MRNATSVNVTTVDRIKIEVPGKYWHATCELLEENGWAVIDDYMCHSEMKANKLVTIRAEREGKHDVRELSAEVVLMLA